MNALVTPAQGKAHLYIVADDTTHDFDVELKIVQASAIVLQHMKLATVPAEWLVGSPVIVDAPPIYQACTLAILAELYSNREASVFNIDNILKLLPRDPTLA